MHVSFWQLYQTDHDIPTLPPKKGHIKAEAPHFGSASSALIEIVDEPTRRFYDPTELVNRAADGVESSSLETDI